MGCDTGWNVWVKTKRKFEHESRRHGIVHYYIFAAILSFFPNLSPIACFLCIVKVDRMTSKNDCLMKKCFLSTAVAAVCLLGTVSCDQHKNDVGTTIPQPILDAFESDYPLAKSVTWAQKSGPAVADFTLSEDDGSQSRNAAWYDLVDYARDMDEKELPYERIPEAVRTAFEATEYAAEPWQRDREVDCLTRGGYEVLYVIEVEKRENGVETELALYFTAAGELVREVADADPNEDYEEYLPQTPAASVDEWLAERFPDARIIDVDKEDGLTEVELLADGLKHEVYFQGDDFVMLKTEYEGLDLQRLDAAILAAVQAQYPNGTIDEVERCETTEQVYYCVELLDGRREVQLCLDEAGQVIERPEPPVGSVPVDDGQAQFIADRYPDAVTIDRDYDDGYVVIEIRHEGVEKEVRFNGQGEWVDTSWEMRSSALPQAVLDKLAAQYPAYRLGDEAEVFDTPQGLRYEVELEGRDELTVTLDASGNVLGERWDD